MWAVDTYSAADLRRLVKGGFDATVEVQGLVFCENPIISLAAHIPCCYFHTTVARQSRRTRSIKSGSGMRTQTHYVWVNEMDEKISTPFKVRDKTGETVVDPARASIDTETVLNKVVRYREPWFGDNVRDSDTGRYRIRESVFIHEGFVYVLGQATTTKAGEAQIRFPKKGYMDPKRKIFLVSRKSEKELTQKKQKVGRVLKIMSAFFFLALMYSLLAYFGLAPGLSK